MLVGGLAAKRLSAFVGVVPYTGSWFTGFACNCYSCWGLVHLEIGQQLEEFLLGPLQDNKGGQEMRNNFTVGLNLWR